MVAVRMNAESGSEPTLSKAASATSWGRSARNRTLTLTFAPLTNGSACTCTVSRSTPSTVSMTPAAGSTGAPAASVPRVRSEPAWRVGGGEGARAARDFAARVGLSLVATFLGFVAARGALSARGA